MHTVSDYFTRLGWAKALPTKEARNVVSALKEVMGFVITILIISGSQVCTSTYLMQLFIMLFKVMSFLISILIISGSQVLYIYLSNLIQLSFIMGIPHNWFMSLLPVKEVNLAMTWIPAINILVFLLPTCSYLASPPKHFIINISYYMYKKQVKIEREVGMEWQMHANKDSDDGH